MVAFRGGFALIPLPQQPFSDAFFHVEKYPRLSENGISWLRFVRFCNFVQDVGVVFMHDSFIFTSIFQPLASAVTLCRRSISEKLNQNTPVGISTCATKPLKGGATTQELLREKVY